MFYKIKELFLIYLNKLLISPFFFKFQQFLLIISGYLIVILIVTLVTRLPYWFYEKK